MLTVGEYTKENVLIMMEIRIQNNSKLRAEESDSDLESDLDERRFITKRTRMSEFEKLYN